jgi:hypothetical protein
MVPTLHFQAQDLQHEQPLVVAVVAPTEQLQPLVVLAEVVVAAAALLVLRELAVKVMLVET